MQTTPNADHAKRYGEAIDALNKRDWQQAQQLSMHLLREVPSHAGVYFVAGVAARELMQMPLAIECLQRAVQINPARSDYMAQLARALAQASKPGPALETADKALLLAPSSDPLTYDTLGVVYSQVHAYAQAAGMFQRVVELQPDQARYRFNYATALIHAGDIDGAERELESCLALEPDFWKAYLSLSQLRKQTVSGNHVERLENQRLKAGDMMGQLCLNLALSKEFEDLGDYPKAFAHLVTGKAAVHGKRGYDVARDRELFEAVKAASPAGDSASRGHPSKEPIFIFGMPRTGTTLIERIISSHPEVYSAGELQNFGVALKRASGSQTPPMLDLDTIQHAHNLDWRRLGEQYVESTRPGTGKRPRFIDKLPHNFLHAGFIAASLPNAKLICLRRDPMDTCLSNFRQLFALSSRNYDYSFNLLDTGRYYLLFDNLMAFWQEHLPGRILEVSYEDVVDNQAANTRRLLEFCGLDWNDACLRFEENEAPVATASAVQVRAPMYRTAMKRWKRYEPQLADLRKLLEGAGIPITD